MGSLKKDDSMLKLSLDKDKKMVHFTPKQVATCYEKKPS